jgi:hypothetical protein
MAKALKMELAARALPSCIPKTKVLSVASGSVAAPKKLCKL